MRLSVSILRLWQNTKPYIYIYIYKAYILLTFSDFFDSRQLKGNIFSIFVIAIAAAEEILGIMNFRLKQDQYSE